MAMTHNDQLDRQLLRRDGCTYLGPDYDSRTWDYNAKPTPYCGCKDLHGDSLYCKEHYPLMYSRGTALRKRKKDLKRVDKIREIEQLVRDCAEELEESGWEPRVNWLA